MNDDATDTVEREVTRALAPFLGRPINDDLKAQIVAALNKVLAPYGASITRHYIDATLRLLGFRTGPDAPEVEPLHFERVTDLPGWAEATSITAQILAEARHRYQEAGVLPFTAIVSLFVGLKTVAELQGLEREFNSVVFQGRIARDVVDPENPKGRA